MWSIGLVKKLGWTNLKKNLLVAVLGAGLLHFLAYAIDTISVVVSNFRLVMKVIQISTNMLNYDGGLNSFKELVDVITFLWMSGKNDYLSALGWIINFLILAVTLFLLKPIWIGYYRWFLDNRQSKPNFAPFFMAFRKTSYRRILLGSSWIWLWKSIWRITAILILLPGVGLILVGILSSLFHELAWSDTPGFFSSSIAAFILFPLGILLLLLSAVFSLCLFLNRYYAYIFAPFFLADNPVIGGKDALNASKNLAKGMKLKLLAFDLSYIGWHILAFLTSGVLYLLITPYRYSALAEIYASRDEVAKA